VVSSRVQGMASTLALRHRYDAAVCVALTMAALHSDCSRTVPLGTDARAVHRRQRGL